MASPWSSLYRFLNSILSGRTLLGASGFSQGSDPSFTCRDCRKLARGVSESGSGICRVYGIERTGGHLACSAGIRFGWVRPGYERQLKQAAARSRVVRAVRQETLLQILLWVVLLGSLSYALFNPKVRILEQDGRVYVVVSFDYAGTKDRLRSLAGQLEPLLKTKL